MPPEFFDYDPLLGVTKYFDYDESKGDAVIRSEQDLQPLLSRNAELRNTGATDYGIKGEFWHYASIPPVVQLELRRKGIDIYSKDKTMIRRMFDEINANYPALKVTQKAHR